jgi:cobalamin biosynthesis Mg chelatase CobN
MAARRSPIARSVAGAPDTYDWANPTKNVEALVEASVKSLSNEAVLRAQLADSNIAHQKEIGQLRERYQEAIGKLREDHQARMQAAEAGRLDSIRQVDREEVAKTAITANTAIATLAKQTTDLATTLQSRVDATASAAEARSSAQYNDITKRLQAVELSLSEGKGKQGVADPQMDKLTLLVETLATNQSRGQGSKEGMSDGAKILIAVVGLFATVVGIVGGLVTIAGVAYAVLK